MMPGGSPVPEMFPCWGWTGLDAFEAEALGRAATGFNGYRLETVDGALAPEVVGPVGARTVRDAVVDVVPLVFDPRADLELEVEYGKVPQGVPCASANAFTLKFAKNARGKLVGALILGDSVADAHEPPPIMCEELDAEWSSADELTASPFMTTITDLRPRPDWSILRVHLRCAGESIDDRLLVWTR